MKKISDVEVEKVEETWIRHFWMSDADAYAEGKIGGWHGGCYEKM